MSAHFQVKLDSPRHEHHDLDEPEESEEIPSEVLLLAQQEIKDFYQAELPDSSADSMKWVMERLAPAMAQKKIKVQQVDIREVENFLQDFSVEVEEQILFLNTLDISFSRGHELDKRTYPSTEKMEPIISWVKAIGKRYDLYKKVPNFKQDFETFFNPFVATLLCLVKNQALQSRNAQLEALLLNQDKMSEEEFVGQKSLIEAHIHYLETKPAQPFLEFRDLLNLSQLPWLERKPTMDEQEAYRFLAKFV
ncbi:hypothetical protein [Simkania sp.]|uniref:hypothetical protein n=1 Tax=Simkania sp. TaxID=34094 RepID=UPI003B52C187